MGPTWAAWTIWISDAKAKVSRAFQYSRRLGALERYRAVHQRQPAQHPSLLTRRLVDRPPALRGSIMNVARILKVKGIYVATVAPDAKIADVIEALESEDTGALVVSSDDTNIDGIISERDVVRGLLLLGAEVLSHSVSDLMTTDVVTCNADDHVAGVMAMMSERRIRHIPVVDDGKLAGIISIGDIVKLRLDEVQAEADAMRLYISG